MTNLWRNFFSVDSTRRLIPNFWIKPLDNKAWRTKPLGIILLSKLYARWTGRLAMYGYFHPIVSTKRPIIALIFCSENIMVFGYFSKAETTSSLDQPHCLRRSIFLSHVDLLSRGNARTAVRKLFWRIKSQFLYFFNYSSNLIRLDWKDYWVKDKFNHSSWFRHAGIFQQCEIRSKNGLKFTRKDARRSWSLGWCSYLN